MKVFYPIVRTYSGGDVYFEELSRAIGELGHQAAVRYYSHWLDFAPAVVQRAWAGAPNADLVHTKVEYGAAFAQAGKPLVVKLAHLVFDPLYASYRSLAQRLYHRLKIRPNLDWSLRHARARVAISRAARDAYRQHFGPLEIEVIYNGVDAKRFHPLPDLPPDPEKHTRLFFAGNLSRRKGADLLPRILGRLGENFLLYYTTGLRSARPLAGPGGMRPLGRLTQRELVEQYNRADIFVFPSRLEGFGFPVVEAMACGKPVVGTRVASLPELVDEGQGGFLCARDDVEDFARQIRRLAEDPELRRAMGRYNRAKVERCFTLAGCARQHAALYESLRR